jgi:hypothetical protein
MVISSGTGFLKIHNLTVSEKIIDGTYSES